MNADDCNGNSNGIFTAEDAEDAKDCFIRHPEPRVEAETAGNS